MALTHTQHLALGGLLLALALLLVAILWLRHLQRNQHRRRVGQPPKSLTRHLATHRGKHISALALAAIGVVLLVTAGTAAYVILHHGGARFDPHKRIPPPHVLPQGGGNGATPNLGLYLPQPYNQQASNSCWCQSVSAALYGAEHQAGHTMPVPSPWRCFWYGAGGQDSTGTLEQAVAAYNQHGAEPLPYWPVQGPPDSQDAGRTTTYTGASVRYIYYGAGYGASTVGAIQNALDAGHLVTILWDVHANALRSGQWVIDNSGAHEFFHFSVLYGYQRNADGSLSFVGRNSWGDAWGVHGDALWTQTVVVNNVLAAAIISAGHPVPADVWTPPTVTPLPAPTSTPRPHATVTPAPKPTACLVRRLTLKKGANLHATHASSPVVVGLSRGQVVMTFCPTQTAPGWVRVRAGARAGWLQTAAL